MWQHNITQILRKNDGRSCNGLRIHFATNILLVINMCYVGIHFDDPGEFNLGTELTMGNGFSIIFCTKLICVEEYVFCQDSTTHFQCEYTS